MKKQKKLRKHINCKSYIFDYQQHFKSKYLKTKENAIFLTLLIYETYLYKLINDLYVNYKELTTPPVIEDNTVYIIIPYIGNLNMKLYLILDQTIVCLHTIYNLHTYDSVLISC